MKPNKKRNNKVASVEEWLHFSWSYLELAEITCDYWAIRFKDLKNFSKNYPGFSEQTSARSFLPIIFNVKHSLELFLKRISASLGVKIDHVHDLKELSKNIKEINWVSIRKKIGGLSSKSPDDGGIREAQRICNEKGVLENKTKELIDIIDKYYHLKLVMGIIGTEFLFSDTENTAFKYPENDLVVSFDYSDFIEKITVDNFLEIKKDIEKIKECYSNIGFILRFYAKIK